MNKKNSISELEGRFQILTTTDIDAILKESKDATIKRYGRLLSIEEACAMTEEARQAIKRGEL